MRPWHFQIIDIFPIEITPNVKRVLLIFVALLDCLLKSRDHGNSSDCCHVDSSDDRELSSLCKVKRQVGCSWNTMLGDIEFWCNVYLVSGTRNLFRASCGPFRLLGLGSLVMLTPNSYEKCCQDFRNDLNNMEEI